MNSKYFNDAVIGNKQMVVSLSKTGELLRLLYPNVDYKQFTDFFHVGLRINDSGIIYLHNDINNVYEQNYIENTNILKTEIVNTYFNVKIIQTDFVLLKEPILVRKYEISNESNMDLDVNLLAYSKLLSNHNNQVSGFVNDEALIQYTHDYNFCIFSKEKMLSSQVNNSNETIMSGEIYDKDYIGMSPDSAISYDLKKLHAGEKKEFILFIYVQENGEKYNLHDIECNIDRIKHIDISKELEQTKSYWRKNLKAHTKLPLKQPKNAYYERIERIYNRTVLLYSLLVNHKVRWNISRH